MGNVNARRKSMAIKLKNRRTKKLHELRDKYQNADSSSGKQRIVEKIRRVAPHLLPEEYLGVAQAARPEAKPAPAAPRRSTAKKE